MKKSLQQYLVSLFCYNKGKLHCKNGNEEDIGVILLHYT